jgi:hypothetical protein
MKKTFIATYDDDTDKHRYSWELPNNIRLSSMVEYEHCQIYMDDEYQGTVTMQMASDLFDALLYPPGSVPSPESADPTDKHRMKEEKERQWDIPRVDILDNGDWY